jgi:hypothetical protein
MAPTFTNQGIDVTPIIFTSSHQYLGKDHFFGASLDVGYVIIPIAPAAGTSPVIYIQSFRIPSSNFTIKNIQVKRNLDIRIRRALPKNNFMQIGVDRLLYSTTVDLRIGITHENINMIFPANGDKYFSSVKRDYQLSAFQCPHNFMFNINEDFFFVNQDVYLTIYLRFDQTNYLGDIEFVSLSALQSLNLNTANYLLQWLRELIEINILFQLNKEDSCEIKKGNTLCDLIHRVF